MGLGSLINNDIGQILGFLQNRSAGQQQQVRDEQRNNEVAARTKQIETGQVLDVMTLLDSIGQRDAQADSQAVNLLTQRSELDTAIALDQQRLALAVQQKAPTAAIIQGQLDSKLNLQRALDMALGSIGGQKENNRALTDSLYQLATRNAQIDGVLQLRDKTRALTEPQMQEQPQQAQPMQQPSMEQGAQAGGPQPAAQQALAPGMTWEQSAAASGLATPEEADAAYKQQEAEKKGIRERAEARLKLQREDAENARKQQEDADKIARDQAEADQEDEEQYLNAEATRYREVKDSVKKDRASITSLSLETFPKLSEVAQIAVMGSIAKDKNDPIIKAMADAYGTASPQERKDLIETVQKRLGDLADEAELELKDLEPEVNARKERQRARFKVKPGESYAQFVARYAKDNGLDMSKEPTPKQNEDMRKAFLKGSKK